MLKAVLFDFDGVIADSEKAHFLMFNKTLQCQELEITWEEYCQKYLGYSDLECFTKVLQDKGETVNQERLNTLFQEKKEHFRDYIAENSLIIPGIRILLDDLKDNDIVCAVCSGALKIEIETMLHQDKLSHYFEVIVAADDVKKGKPSPEGYLQTLMRLNALDGRSDYLRAEECIVIEDSLWGIKAAQSAEMKCLAIASSYPPDELRAADKVVDNIEAVNLELLKSILM